MYLGIDAGGTKTEALLIAPDGAICARGRFGPGNWESIGIDAAIALYRGIVEQLVSDARINPDSISAVGWGLAGVDWTSDEQRMTPLLVALLPQARHTVVNDAYLPLRAGSDHPYGVAIIAGTGSTVVAVGMDGQRARTFGLGSDWGDFDGAQQLTRAACRVAAQAEYGMVPATLLTPALLSWSGAPSIPALAESWSRGGSVPDLATFAPLLMNIARLGDSAAQQIVREAAITLARNASAMARRVDLQERVCDVVLAGGVATGANDVFRATFDTVLRAECPYAKIQILQRAPVAGAVLLAMDSVGHSMLTTRTEW
jgi:N-acetylglucosamine kinase-like BadF-type ATPase